jgi:large subunit ribosomal protein L4
MQLDVVDIELKKVGTTEVPDGVFGAEINEALLWEQCRAQRASARAGTHATKTRADVSGGGAKPFKQKGTGRARQGSSRAPNHVGGGTVFGPHPRDYSYRLPRTARRAALRSALSLRLKDQAFVVLRDFDVEKPRTKVVEAFFARSQANSLLLVDTTNTNLQLSARNLPKTKFIQAAALNVFDIIKHQRLVVTQAALAVIIEKAALAAETEQGA